MGGQGAGRGVRAVTEPHQELTPRDRLIARLVDLSQHLPGGYQVALGVRLGQSVAAAEELIAELTYWRCHTDKA